MSKVHLVYPTEPLLSIHWAHESSLRAYHFSKASALFTNHITEMYLCALSVIINQSSSTPFFKSVWTECILQFPFLDFREESKFKWPTFCTLFGKWYQHTANLHHKVPFLEFSIIWIVGNHILLFHALFILNQKRDIRKKNSPNDCICFTILPRVNLLLSNTKRK